MVPGVGPPPARRGAACTWWPAYAHYWIGCGTPPPLPSTPATAVDPVSLSQPTYTTIDGNGTHARSHPPHHADYGPPWSAGAAAPARPATQASARPPIGERDQP